MSKTKYHVNNCSVNIKLIISLLTRVIYRSFWTYDNNMLNYEVEGNAFLPHQVRRMVGSLVDLGRGRLFLEDVKDLLSCKGSARSNSMPSKGLCLEKVIYENYSILTPTG